MLQILSTHTHAHKETNEREVHNVATIEILSFFPILIRHKRGRGHNVCASRRSRTYPFPQCNTLKISELRKIVDPPSPPYPFALSRSTGIIDQFLPPPPGGSWFRFRFRRRKWVWEHNAAQRRNNDKYFTKYRTASKSKTTKKLDRRVFVASLPFPIIGQTPHSTCVVENILPAQSTDPSRNGFGRRISPPGYTNTLACLLVAHTGLPCSVSKRCRTLHNSIKYRDPGARLCVCTFLHTHSLTHERSFQSFKTNVPLAEPVLLLVNWTLSSVPPSFLTGRFSCTDESSVPPHSRRRRRMLPMPRPGQIVFSTTRDWLPAVLAGTLVYCLARVSAARTQLVVRGSRGSPANDQNKKSDRFLPSWRKIWK